MDTDVCAREVTQVANEADKNLVGWAYWEFKTYKDLTTSAGDRSEGFYNFDGTLEAKKVQALARSYVQAAQGTIESMKFHLDQDGEFPVGTLVADVKVDTDITAPTIVHALQKHDELSWYPEGLTVEVKSLEDSNVTPVFEQNIVGNKIEITVTNPEFDSKRMRIIVKPGQESKNIETIFQ